MKSLAPRALNGLPETLISLSFLSIFFFFNMGEVVNVIVAFAVIVFIFRWATSSNPNSGPTPADTLGFRPKNVSQDMVDTIGNMFPDLPKYVFYSLSVLLLTCVCAEITFVMTFSALVVWRRRPTRSLNGDLLKL